MAPPLCFETNFNAKAQRRKVEHFWFSFRLSVFALKLSSLFSAGKILWKLLTQSAEAQRTSFWFPLRLGVFAFMGI
jgi:hypothetical protein